MVSILGGIIKPAKTVHRRVLSMESWALVSSIKHI